MYVKSTLVSVAIGLFASTVVFATDDGSLAFERHDVKASMTVFEGFVPANLDRKVVAEKMKLPEGSAVLLNQEAVTSIAVVSDVGAFNCSIQHPGTTCSVEGAEGGGPEKCSSQAGHEWLCSAMHGSDAENCSVGIEAENEHCSADQAGEDTHCSVIVVQGQAPKPCSVNSGAGDDGNKCSTNVADNEGYDGWCSAAGQNDSFCSARGDVTECSVDTDTHDGTVYCSAQEKGFCSTMDNENDGEESYVCSIAKFDRPANCSASDELDGINTTVACSATVNQSLCSIAKDSNPSGDGKAFCSVNPSAPEGSCSVIVVGDGTGTPGAFQFCSVFLDTSGTNADNKACSVRGDANGDSLGGQCTTFNTDLVGGSPNCSTNPVVAGGSVRCSVVKPDGSVDGPDGKGMCGKAPGGPPPPPPPPMVMNGIQKNRLAFFIVFSFGLTGVVFSFMRDENW